MFSHLLAASSSDPVGYLLNFGVLGVIVVLALSGFIWFKPSVDREIKKNDKVEAQRDKLLDVHENTTLPVLKDVNDKLIPLATQIRDELHELRREIASLRDQRRQE